ncbi:hypothetical protein BaRGS_00022826 [Batillaria attramentaria]|uniref:Secreted protein n=1 Tax=Batillaria attramentaria TaxID=370345 RepID=A0ABD0KG52_9CAEN
MGQSYLIGCLRWGGDCHANEGRRAGGATAERASITKPKLFFRTCVFMTSLFAASLPSDCAFARVYAATEAGHVSGPLPKLDCVWVVLVFLLLPVEERQITENVLRPR